MSKVRQSSATTVPAPVGGLNVYDSLPTMPPIDSVLMRNLMPGSSGCSVRRGFQNQSVGFSGDVATLMALDYPDGSSKLFAADDFGIYDVTAGIDASVAVPVTANTDSFWQHTQMANAAGVHLVAFNGVDNGFLYSTGVGYNPLVAGDGVVPYTISGVDPVNLIHCCIHQRRLWMVEKDTSRAWYLPPESVYGVATSFDFGGSFARGGYLQAVASWTVDNGIGVDDKLLAISSRGDVALYSGFDPSDPDNWKLEGVYYAGSTFARRCWENYGGDVAMLTEFGMVTISSLLDKTVSVGANPIALKIQRLLGEYITKYRDKRGWQIRLAPSEDLLIVNLPGLNSSLNSQLAMNTITGAWAVMLGMPAVCWERYRSGIMFGTTSVVNRGLYGTLDGVDMLGEGGRPRRAEVVQAYNYFGKPGQNKHVKMFRPNFVYSGDFTYSASATLDFNLGGSPAPVTPESELVGVWDESQWDSGVVWGGGVLVDAQWVFVVGIGYAATIHMRVETTEDTVWVSTDWLYEVGGVV